MSCSETLASYAFRSLGFGERRLPTTDITLCDQVTLIGSGMLWNIYFGLLAILLGFFSAQAIALAKASSNKTLRKPAEWFIFVFRGSPLFIQFFFGYFLFLSLKQAFPLFDNLTDAWLGAAIVLWLNTTAYSAEIFFGALMAVPKGDLESADAYGFSGWPRFRRIVWPTMLRLAWPAYTNEAIFIFHSTTLVFFSGFPALQQKGDALYYASYFADKTFNPFIPYPILAGYFVLVTLCIITVFGLIGKRLNRHLPQGRSKRPRLMSQIFRQCADMISPHGWLAQNPDVKTIRVAAADLNGQARGKRMSARFADKVETEGTRFPLSVLNLDIWGEDIEDSPLVFESGDQDGVLLPTERGFVPMPWLESATALLPMWMFHEDGSPFGGDPRQALARVLDRYKAKGLTPVVATELEFYLIDDSSRQLRVPRSPRSGKRRPGAETLALRALDAFDIFFSELFEACEAMDIPADTAISEAGLGQFEINLAHSPDALRAADDAWLFKLMVKGLARKHGFAASFMAKPYDEYAGNGMHTHFSMLDENGDNIFDDSSTAGTDMMRHAIAGCLSAIPDSTILFAPHGNSYDRLVPGAHAPTRICWGYDNRTAAVRVPGGSHKARRIEHRVSGGDVNPHLMIAAILGAALIGMEDEMKAPPPITGNAYAQGLPEMPGDWGTAIDTFAASPLMKRIFSEELVRNLTLTKRQELRDWTELTPEEQVELYLDTV